MTTATKAHPITADPIFTYPMNLVVNGRRRLVIDRANSPASAKT